jgi:hypothetical protein
MGRRHPISNSERLMTIRSVVVRMGPHGHWSKIDKMTDKEILDIVQYDRTRTLCIGHMYEWLKEKYGRALRVTTTKPIVQKEVSRMEAEAAYGPKAFGPSNVVGMDLFPQKELSVQTVWNMSPLIEEIKESIERENKETPSTEPVGEMVIDDFLPITEEESKKIIEDFKEIVKEAEAETGVSVEGAINRLERMSKAERKAARKAAARNGGSSNE